MSSNPPQITPQTLRFLFDGRLTRLAWLPIPLLLAVMAVLWAADLRVSYESPYLVMALSFVFSTLMSLFIVFLMGRSFVAWGAPGRLLLGCGVVIWGVAGPVGVAAGPGDANIQITIHNTCVWLSALFHLAGVILSFRSQWTLRARGLWLGASYVVVLGAVSLTTLAAIEGWLPIFFVQGQGGTPARQFALGSAITLFALTAVLLWETNRPTLSSFIYWYVLSLLLFAAGLFGVMIQSVAGSLLGWTGRVAQFLGGIYMLMAALASRRESGARGITMGQMRIGAPYRFGVAIVLVIAAAAVRLVFLQGLETHSTSFVTFYPAVVPAAFYGGRKAGFLATVLSALLMDYFWMEPVGQFGISNPSDWSILTAFLVSCTMLSWIIDAMHRAQARANVAEAEARFAAERTRAAEALRESEERWRALMDHVPMSIQGYNSDGIVMYWNRASERLYGYTSAEAIGRNLGDLIVPPEMQPHFRQALSASLSLKASGEFMPAGEIELLRKDGSLVSLYSTHTAVCIPSGPPRLFCLDMDLTERKRAEEEIRRHMEKLQAANEELARFNRAAVGRELRMVELKKEVNELRVRIGQAARYPLAFEKKAGK